MQLFHKNYYEWKCEYSRVDKNLIIKVADFGLAKDVYMTDYYRHESIERMPVKWMAPEAMYDRISNEKTDVVSFVLQKLFGCVFCNSLTFSSFHYSFTLKNYYAQK